MKWMLRKAANGYVLETYNKETNVYVFKTWTEVIAFLTEHPTIGGKEGAE